MQMQPQMMEATIKINAMDADRIVAGLKKLSIEDAMDTYFKVRQQLDAQFLSAGGIPADAPQPNAEQSPTSPV